MKGISILEILAGLLVLAALGGSPACAQSEIAPDQFESPNVEPFEKPKVNARGDAMAIRYDGKVTLPFTLQCNRKSLPPGRYSVSLQSDGKTGQATLKRRGRAIDIAGMVHKQAQKYESDTLVVELNGRTRRLSAIHLAELDFVFEPKLPVESSSRSMPRRFEKLLLTGSGQGKR
ncbi:MAG TPA: hypothetical protein VJO16_16130 [Candidatus Acidoferrum sp.]|nr:hypothetical protein [Candidatus Acidoferrum sp.]